MNIPHIRSEKPSLAYHDKRNVIDIYGAHFPNYQNSVFALIKGAKQRLTILKYIDKEIKISRPKLIEKFDSMDCNIRQIIQTFQRNGLVCYDQQSDTYTLGWKKS